MREPFVERHDGPLDALAADWARLVDETRPGAPFRAFPWISSWWHLASTSRTAQVLVARDGDRPVGLLALYAEPRFGGARLRLMGDGIVGSDYMGAIARAADLERVSRAFAAHLSRDELRLDDLDADDPLVAALVERGARVEPRYLCPYVCTSGGDFAGWLATRADGLSTQLERRRRWLERRRDFRIDELAAPDEIERGIDILLELHRRRWQADGSQAIDGPRVERFHRAAARGLAERGLARIFLLHADGAARAALYGFRHADRFAFYQAGFDPEWRPRSVGTVLLVDVVRRCFVERLFEFDFLRGDEQYKLRLATHFRRTVRVVARAPGLGPWLYAHGAEALARLRSTARDALPEAARAWVRRRRRQWIALRGGSS
jgi:CelD/BcsL family acetyltransferase involved in cellulose biosynthesis